MLRAITMPISAQPGYPDLTSKRPCLSRNHALSLRYPGACRFAKRTLSMPKSASNSLSGTKTGRVRISTIVSMKILHFIDSHTGGEPTRLVTSGGPDLGGGTLAERLENLRTKHDDWRSGVVTEPRG